MEDVINELLGPSILMLVVDMFLEYPRQLMNLREVARRVSKNPGSISPVMPTLLKRGIVIGCKVGKVSVVYQLNYDNEKVKVLMAMRKRLKSVS